MGDLLYVSEHTSCKHYKSDYETAFSYREYDRGTELDIENRPYHIILFLHEGEMVMDCNEFKGIRLTDQQMIFIPKSASVHIRVEKAFKGMILMFDGIKNICDKMHLHSYWNLCKDRKYTMDPTRIRPQLYNFLGTLEYYLLEGINCEHFHEIKQQELFLILRWFYLKEELAYLFYPIIGPSPDFKNLILENYLKVENVSELADLSHMSRSNFDARFKKEFGMPPRQWMLKQTAKHVLYHLSAPDVAISEVMHKFNFNSPTHFTRFCRQQFGQTPTELIARIQDEVKEE